MLRTWLTRRTTRDTCHSNKTVKDETLTAAGSEREDIYCYWSPMSRAFDTSKAFRFLPLRTSDPVIAFRFQLLFLRITPEQLIQTYSKNGGDENDDYKKR